jgi:hypothetical protein
MSHIPKSVILIISLLAFLGGCATTANTEKAARELLQKKSDVNESPRALVTQYSSALEAFGRLLEVYRAPGSVLYVQTRNINDATGLSHPLVGAELPNDVTEMVRSAINRIGDRVVYVPFHPEYVFAHAQQGAQLKLTLPDVLITGAITEFDRALSSAGKANNVDLTIGKGRGETGISADRKATSTLSNLALDLNLVDFQSQVMVPKMQAANTIHVLNETYEHSLDFAIYGSGFGLVSNTRYLQGRHSALRLLVELSVLEVLGRYTTVPYWRCIPNAKVDRFVIARIQKNYQSLDQATKVQWLQNSLKEYGFPLQATKSLDAPTKVALDEIVAKFNLQRPTDYLDSRLFADVYTNIPITAGRRKP